MAGLGPNKQFTCDIPDCRQCFLSEDHLSPYPLRHDLDGKTCLLPLDQTPTPTTIFRKCEEAGLLQALPLENPFEETFRKATEEIKSGVHPLGELPLHPNAPESLNTPQVLFPGTSERRAPSVEPPSRLVPAEADPGPSPPCLSLDPIQPSSIVRREADTSDGKSDDNDVCSNRTVSRSKFICSSNGTPANQICKVRTENTSVTLKTTGDTDASRSVQVLLKLPDGKLVQLSTLPVEPVTATGGTGHPNIPIIKVDAPTDSTENDSTASLPSKVSLAKQKLKQALMTNTCPAATGPTATNTNNKQVVRDTSVHHLQVPQTIPQQATFARSDDGQKSGASNDDDADARRRKFLERNRAAAMRCREKKKTWVQELERNSNEIMRTNQQLEKEVAFLRTEVAHLKTLLLAHKDCPVTKAMARGQAALPGFITALPAASTIAKAASQPQLLNLPRSSASTMVIQPPARPVLLLNDPRSKRRRYTSAGEESSPSSKDTAPEPFSAVNQIAVSSVASSTVSPVIISNFVSTAAPTLIAPMTKQAFILPKTDAPVGAAVSGPPLLASAFTGTGTVHAWDKRDSQQERLQNRNSSILSTNVIKVNPNVVDRDVEIIDVKAKESL